jgi:hypothetical protein
MFVSVLFHIGLNTIFPQSFMVVLPSPSAAFMRCGKGAIAIAWQGMLKLHRTLTIHILMDNKHAGINEQQDLRKLRLARLF